MDRTFTNDREYYGPDSDKETNTIDFSGDPNLLEFEHFSDDPNLLEFEDSSMPYPTFTDQSNSPNNTTHGSITNQEHDSISQVIDEDITSISISSSSNPSQADHISQNVPQIEKSTHEQDLTIQEDITNLSRQSEHTTSSPPILLPQRGRIRIPNPRVFGDDWVNSTVCLTPSSRTFIGHILPSMSHDDIFLHSLDWDAPFVHDYLGYLSIEHLHTDPFTSEIEWMHPLSMAAKATSADTPTLREIHQMNRQEIEL